MRQQLSQPFHFLCMLNQSVSHSPWGLSRLNWALCCNMRFPKHLMPCNCGLGKHHFLGFCDTLLCSSSLSLNFTFLHFLHFIFLIRIFSSCSSLRDSHSSPLPLDWPWLCSCCTHKNFTKPPAPPHPRNILEHLYPKLHSSMTHSHGNSCPGLDSPDRPSSWNSHNLTLTTE